VFGFKTDSVFNLTILLRTEGYPGVGSVDMDRQGLEILHIEVLDTPTGLKRMFNL